MSEQTFTAKQKATVLLLKVNRKPTSNMTPFDNLVGVFRG